MDIRRVGRENAQLAEGVVVAIDVIRAFSVAAYAFAGGAETLWLVRTIEEAFALRQSAGGILEGAAETPLLIGEVKGRLVPGFDLNNSPTMMQAADVKGRSLLIRLFAHQDSCGKAASFILGFTGYIHQPPLYSATWGQMGPEKPTKCQ